MFLKGQKYHWYNIKASVTTIIELYSSHTAIYIKRKTKTIVKVITHPHECYKSFHLLCKDGYTNTYRTQQYLYKKLNCDSCEHRWYTH